MAGDENNRIYRDALSRMIDLKADMKQSRQMVDELKIKFAEKPNSIFLRNMLIRAYMTTNQTNEAERMIDEAIASGHEEWFLYQKNGDLLYSKNLLQEALLYFNKAWKIDSETYCDTLYSLLCVYKKLGENEKAIEVCKK